ncbi:MAG: 16S rRNA (uracil(1498)-N(3))-methyltransferase [Flavobacteriales bacterium]|nr:16S rRNA (uracil(1498)-N(3))-methyltransferase [Flavobacteriales bacterium]MBP9079689.1 16S rRNA (uracil(1498)-N(3))-methyltransferase [Flavobacteriales bacterium]
MHLFHCPSLQQDRFDLPEEEAHHALHVLRLAVGQVIGLLDGKGGFAEAGITGITKRNCAVQVHHREGSPPERKARIHLAVAPTKQIERFEWFLEKATELGVDRITPVKTSRTERTNLRMDRLERVLIGAMKQSQRRWLPHLDAMTGLQDLSSTAPSQRFFGWCEEEHEAFSGAYNPTLNTLVLIGPEGDFTPEEAAMLSARGFRAVGLGRSRLRTETAAIAACTWMNFAQH